MTSKGSFTPARVSTSCLVAVGTGAVGWVVMDWWQGDTGGFFPLPWTAVAGTAALAVAVLASGLPVRRWVRGRRDRPLDPLVAARTVVLAKAAAYAGAGLAGWYAAQTLMLVDEKAAVLRNRLWLAVAATLFAVGLSVAGFVVQRWCRVPRDQDDDRPVSPA